jgi:hypothetical protein
MSIVAFAGEIRVESTNSGVTLYKKGENWGDPWPVSDEYITVRDVAALIRALQQVQSEKSYSEW